MTFPTWRDWLFSAKSFLAAIVALYIALSLDLPRPYWAMAAVYVVANPLSGATASKALYRCLGTLIGAAGAVALLPPLSDAPVLFCLAMSLWTGCFLFVSLLDRSPRSYVFMLAGYTLPLIALPAVTDPGTMFDVALSRSEEITIGIICASVVNRLLFPASIGPVLGGQLRNWLRDAGDWARAILAGEPNAAATAERQRLAADIRAMDMLISQISYDSAAAGVAGQARELRGRLAILLPILSSLADRLAAVRQSGAEPPGLAAVRAELLAWLPQAAGESGDVQAERIRQQLAALEPRGTERAQWDGLLLSSALERLRELVDLWQDCRALQRRIALGARAGRGLPTFRGRRVARHTQFYDYGMLAFSAVSTTLATLLSCAVWLETGWTDGAGCVVMTAVSCCFFAALDDPAEQIRVFTVWSTVSTIAAAVFLFAILPAVNDFVTLAAVFFVPFLVLGTLVPQPRFNMIAMLCAVFTASNIGLQSRYSADFASFMNSNMASIAGGLFGLVWTLLTRPFGAAAAARRLVRAGWADLAATARGRANTDSERFAGRVFDRLGQLVPRLAQGVPADVAAADVLAELRIGINILDLRRVRPALPDGPRRRVADILDGVADSFAARVRAGQVTPPPDSLLGAIDAALPELAWAPGEAPRTALQALVGLRRALFAQAPPPATLDQPRTLLAAE